MTFTPESLLSRLQALPPAGRYLVAYSGGADSHVLLHALAQIQTRLSQPLIAIHINHGLQADSGQWAAHCEEVCHALAIPIEVIEVEVDSTRGDSLEAAARRARYTAIQAILQPGDAVLTAHHQDDQAETLLLQLLRGAGPRGLAAMAAQAAFGAGLLLRPLLEHKRDALQAYARTVGIEWVEDPSNRETRFDRNFLRHEAMPVLASRWPALASTLARAARHQAEALEVMDEMARQDLAGECTSELPIERLKGLSEARQKNLLRYWIQANGFGLPDERRMQVILTDLLTASEDANPVVGWGGNQLRRYRERLYLQATLPEHDSGLCLRWNGEELVIPSAGGVLCGIETTGLGLKRENLRGGAEVRFRHGGERCRPQGRGLTRDVKKLMQEAGIPPWLRGRIPLIYIDDELAVIPGVCICEAHAAKADEAGIKPIWTWTNTGPAIEMGREKNDN
ncbi:MAG: tRNA lysidine(34) synthetase TilS [Gammaproteobacteria bacterium]|nr:tRNA lysidine(34) synthetase TilS [Gammaproteobacteria bacterium]